ncbi:MAG: hypothetical protein ACM30G_07215 [Micromonosporaceae bacterium]
MSADRPDTTREASMTTWNDLIQYVHNNYKISDERPDMIKMIFDTGGMRSQVVIVWHLRLNDGEEWVQIESPFGELGSLDLGKALQHVGNTVCGGMAMFGNLVTFRHSLPLDNLNINEFESPLRLVTSTADNLEQLLVGGDKF